MVRIKEFHPIFSHDFENINKWHKILGPAFQIYSDMGVDLHYKKYWLDANLIGIWTWRNHFDIIGLYQVMIYIQLEDDVVMYKMRWL